MGSQRIYALDKVSVGRAGGSEQKGFGAILISTARATWRAGRGKSNYRNICISGCLKSRAMESGGLAESGSLEKAG